MEDNVLELSFDDYESSAQSSSILSATPNDRLIQNQKQQVDIPNVRPSQNQKQRLDMPNDRPMQNQEQRVSTPSNRATQKQQQPSELIKTSVSIRTHELSDAFLPISENMIGSAQGEQSKVTLLAKWTEKEKVKEICLQIGMMPFAGRFTKAVIEVQFLHPANHEPLRVLEYHPVEDTDDETADLVSQTDTLGLCVTGGPHIPFGVDAGRTKTTGSVKRACRSIIGHLGVGFKTTWTLKENKDGLWPHRDVRVMLQKDPDNLNPVRGEVLEYVCEFV